MTQWMKPEMGCEPCLPEAYQYIPKPLKPVKEDGNVLSPLPGKVILFDAREEQKITKGHLIAVVEAMKMENEIVSPFDGIVETVSCAAGDTIPAGKILAVIQREEV